jgi:hypothetical protein
LWMMCRWQLRQPRARRRCMRGRQRAPQSRWGQVWLEESRTPAISHSSSMGSSALPCAQLFMAGMLTVC